MKGKGKGKGKSKGKSKGNGKRIFTLALLMSDNVIPVLDKQMCEKESVLHSRSPTQDDPLAILTYIEG